MDNTIFVPSQVVPNPGEEPKERKLVVFLEDNDLDLERSVHSSRVMGGTQYLGLHKAWNRGTLRETPVFKTESDPDRFMADLLESGVKVDKVMEVKFYPSGARTVHGYKPMLMQCPRCGGSMLISDEFSRSGDQLCNECLAAAIETPAEKEDNVGGLESKKKAEEVETQEEMSAECRGDKVIPTAAEAAEARMAEAAKMVEDAGTLPTILPNVWTTEDIVDHVQLFDNHILVEHIQPPDRTKGGIIVPKDAEMKKDLEQQLYRVLAIGPGRNLDSDKPKPVRVAVGDLAIVRRTSAVSFCQQQRDFFIILDQDVVGVIHGVEAKSENPEVS